MLQVNKFCLLTENLQPFKPRQDFVREVYKFMFNSLEASNAHCLHVRDRSSWKNLSISIMKTNIFSHFVKYVLLHHNVNWSNFIGEPKKSEKMLTI